VNPVECCTQQEARLHPSKDQHPQKSVTVSLAASALRRDEEKLQKQTLGPQISELQRRLDHDAEEAERWDGMS
jgi:hypothetical protein